MVKCGSLHAALCTLWPQPHCWNIGSVVLMRAWGAISNLLLHFKFRWSLVLFQQTVTKHIHLIKTVFVYCVIDGFISTAIVTTAMSLNLRPNLRLNKRQGMQEPRITMIMNSKQKTLKVTSLQVQSSPLWTFLCYMQLAFCYCRIWTLKKLRNLNPGSQDCIRWSNVWPYKVRVNFVASESLRKILKFTARFWKYCTHCVKFCLCRSHPSGRTRRC